MQHWRPLVRPGSAQTTPSAPATRGDGPPTLPPLLTVLTSEMKRDFSKACLRLIASTHRILRDLIYSDSATWTASRRGLCLKHTRARAHARTHTHAHAPTVISQSLPQQVVTRGGEARFHSPTRLSGRRRPGFCCILAMTLSWLLPGCPRASPQGPQRPSGPQL